MSVWGQRSSSILASRLPRVCDGPGCVADPIPGSAYCRKCTGRFVRLAERSVQKIARIVRDDVAKMERVAASGCHVYAVRCGQFLKFGSANRVAERVSTLQIGNPEIVTLIASIRCVRSVESAIHKHLDDIRVRGEWFPAEHPRTLRVLELIKGGDVMGLCALIGHTIK